MQYRRAFVPGGSYFFTVVTEQRCRLFADTANVTLLRQAVRSVMRNRPFTIDAIVILPDHIHCIWSLPPEDADFATRWRLIKTWFTKHLLLQEDIRPNRARIKKCQQAIWQHRYWEHLLRDQADYQFHVDYIHYNPVKHGYVSKPVEWPFSSMKRYVKQGVLPADWGTNGVNIPETAGKE
ncbi:MAG: transposase [Gammaproteobacteria bacterium]|nr:transposase [Gammaproteobacteria bacterium]